MNLDTKRVPYGLPVHDHEEENAVLEVIKSHKTIMGEKVKKFESEIATLFGKKFGIMVNSGSSANLLAFEMVDIPSGSGFPDVGADIPALCAPLLLLFPAPPPVTIPPSQNRLQ